MSWKIPLFKIFWDKDDVATVTTAIQAGSNWAIGSNVNLFEKMLSEYLDKKYCLVFGSGTSALHATLLAYGISPGDEVVVPSFTFIATANAPLFVGAKPVFADIDRDTFGLDSESVNNVIGPKTKLILPIHYGGCPCNIKSLREIANDHNLFLVEDAAEALGARIGLRKIGSFGDSAILSFCQNKIITTGEGGAVVTDSKDIYEKLALIRSHGRLENRDYFSSTGCFDYISLGFNFRMSNITASLGLAQLSKIDKIIAMRREHSNYLTSKLSTIKGIKPPNTPDDYYHVYQMYTITLNAESRDKLMNYLSEKGIMTKVYFSPVHLTSFYRRELKVDCSLPVTEAVSKEVLTLPMYPSITNNELDEIVNQITNYFGDR